MAVLRERRALGEAVPLKTIFPLETNNNMTFQSPAPASCGQQVLERVSHTATQVLEDPQLRHTPKHLAGLELTAGEFPLLELPVT